MKKPKFKFIILIAVIAMGLISLTQTGCKKESTNSDQVAYDAADAFAGGRLYDHFMSELNVTDTSLTKHINFYRCKSCHGWDLLGQKGHLISKTPSASYPTIPDLNLYALAQTDPIRDLFDGIKHTGGRKSTDALSSTMPDYGLLLTDAQIWDLVKFLKTGARDVTNFYDYALTGTYPTGSISFSNIGKGGNATAGLAVYAAKCQSCHGANGSSINIYCQGDWLGNVFRDDPFELQHKARFGMPLDKDHPGCSYAGAMTTFPTITDQDIKDLLKMGQDATTFPDYP